MRSEAAEKTINDIKAMIKAIEAKKKVEQDQVFERLAREINKQFLQKKENLK